MTFSELTRDAGGGGGEECGRQQFLLEASTTTTAAATATTTTTTTTTSTLYMVSCRVSVPHPPPPWYPPPQMVKTRIFVYIREGRGFVSKVPTVTGMGPPEPGILVSVVTFEATQLRGVFKVATLSWLGHGFGLCYAQLLTLNPKPVQIYTPEP